MANTVEVSRCGECPFWQFSQQVDDYICNHDKNLNDTETYEFGLPTTCPLNTEETIIKLKKK